ncbi:threonine aldolase family protein [Maricaulis maris]|uniref:L-threonine aldolase n=1 Tax=Maricaulis maris TaxID=74318 RepID=A0A495DDS4_9PROT|nr:beta-eliminating lyase-related protein [Maricaulis maris]RKR00488.1 L-threonine aldolase [Maricaulis maris]
MNAALKARCDLDLGFPFHHDGDPADRLEAVARWMRSEGLGPEAYLTGDSVARLEARMAELLGKPAAAWFPTGTMAQGVAARLHCAASDDARLALHPTSHLALHEEEGHIHLHGLTPLEIGDWSRPLRADDLPAVAGCAFVELPQRHNGGALPDWDGLVALKARAASAGIPLHMDGARIWGLPSAWPGRDWPEICDGFASVYVSFYKDLGASGGAVLAGDSDFIDAAKTWLARMGGRLVSAWPMVPDALRALDLRLGKLPAFVERAREIAAGVGEVDGLSLTPNPPLVNMMHVRLDCDVTAAEAARDAAAEATGVWLGNRFWHFERDPVPALEITIGERAHDADPARIIAAIRVMAAHVCQAQSTSA